MSEHASPTAAERGAATLETGLEALESSSEFHGPVEALDGHHCNDHFAQIYERDDERFTAAVPFVRHGLERDERVMYVVDRSSEDEVQAALRDGGIDVDAALDTGQLSFHTVQDTYLRNGSFEPDEMIDFYADTVAEATAEYEALRIVAETTWLQDEATTVEQFMEYESKINELFADEDCFALCQYDRDGFSPEIVRNIVQTHPHLIYDGAVCHNFYYTPPAEFFAPDEPARENDRMLQTLRERTVAKTELQQRERFLQEFSKITAHSTRSFDAKIRRLLELGTKRFDLEIGYFTRTHDDDTFEIVDAVGPNEQITPGVTDSLCDTYCEKLLASPGPIAVTDAADVGWTTDSAYERFGLDAYFATTVHVGGEEYGTLCFASETPREEPYTDAERAFLDLMGQWMGDELDRRRREQYLRKSYEITSDPDLSFEAKLDQLLELGRQQFGLDIGGVAKIDPQTDYFEVETVSGNHDHLAPGAEYPLSETYCQLVTEDGETAAVTDPADAGFEGKLCYEQFGVKTYLGTHLEVDGEMDRTFWFLSTEPRETPISDEERTLVDLMGQWVEYELERRQRERELERTKTRFETVFEQSNDGIFLIDPDADAFVDVNRAAAEMLGYSRDKLASLRPSDVHPDEMEQFRGFLDEVQETGSAWTEDLHCRHRDGRNLPAEVSASAITLDGRELVLANVRHIEERKEHEQYQRELYDIVADSRASFGQKLDRLLELGRERFALENGYFNRVDVDADEFEVVAAVGPHDLIEPGAVDALSGTFCETHLDLSDPLAAADVCDAELDYLRAHDEYGLEAYFAATVHVGGEEYGTLCFASETPQETPFTEAERTFLDLMAQCVSYELERDHREAQLEQKNDRLESFASLLAHELRNPVTIGQIYSQQLSGAADAEAVDYVTEAFDRIEDMVDVLLILTRGREAISERTPVDLADVAHKAWDSVDAPDAELDAGLTQTIEADETYIRHLFQNLLENAVEHGGTDVTVTVGELDDGFYVADDGIGISAEERDAVFDEGYTTAADNGGTGLGLAFVQKLAEVYDWEYAVTESADGGARFEFRNIT